MSDVLKELKQIFKQPGDGAPEVEIKFRIKSPKLDEILNELVESGVMLKYEFPPNSSNWHYKLKTKLSTNSESLESTLGQNIDPNIQQQITHLSKIVKEIADELGDDFIVGKFKEYQEKYNF